MRSLNDFFLTGVIDDVSTGDQIYLPCPEDGRVVGLYATLNNAITTGDAVLTLKVGGVAVTSGTLTIANAGSAAGTTFSLELSGESSTAAVAKGAAVEVETDGGSSVTCKCYITVVVRR